MKSISLKPWVNLFCMALLYRKKFDLLIYNLLRSMHEILLFRFIFTTITVHVFSEPFPSYISANPPDTAMLHQGGFLMEF